MDVYAAQCPLVIAPYIAKDFAERFGVEKM
jgi:hypothetical protein